MITVYSTPPCPWCHKTKEYLKSLNVKYTDIDVSSNEEKAHEMVEKSGQMGVPVIDINGDVVLGFDKPKLDAALKKHKLV